MRCKIIFLGIFVLSISVQTYYIIAQYTPEEVAARPEWEDFLKTAKITDWREMGSGVTKPLRLDLKKGEVENKGVWKNPMGIRGGYREGWQYEIAAYELDKFLYLNMIPPTVERKFEGKKGSLQLWAEHKFSLLEIMRKKIPLPDTGYLLVRFNRSKYLARAFDSLIGNEDRTQENVFYTEDWRMILIDHSRSFRTAKKYIKRLMYGKSGMRGNKPFRQLPRAFVRRVKALDFENIKHVVGPYLQDKEIKAMLARKVLLLTELEEMIEEKGENKVLY